MTLLNGSFEESSVVLGVPSYWTIASVAQNVSIAAFVAPQLGDGQVIGFEAFEWFDHVDDWGDVDSIGYGDDFESDWSNNVFLTDLIEAVRVSAFFDTTPQEFEDFEEGWGGNEDFDFDWSTVTSVSAVFAPWAHEYEDFEVITVFGGFTPAEFDTVPQDFEDFEDEWTELMITI